MADGDQSSKEARRASVDVLLRKQDWGRMYPELLAFAQARAKSKAVAEDLVQEAMRRVLDAQWEPWDPEKHPNVFDFLTSIINRLLRNDRTSARAHRELVMDREAKKKHREFKTAMEARKAFDPAPGAEERLGARELLERRTELLRTYVGDNEVAQAVVDQMLLGNDEAGAQADATGYPVARIYEARRRITQLVARVTRELPADGSEGEEV
jgi:DNA-directed RNA polymerase specialized sigma24 family protein